MSIFSDFFFTFSKRQLIWTWYIWITCLQPFLGCTKNYSRSWSTVEHEMTLGFPGLSIRSLNKTTKCCSGSDEAGHFCQSLPSGFPHLYPLEIFPGYHPAIPWWLGTLLQCMTRRGSWVSPHPPSVCHPGLLWERRESRPSPVFWFQKRSCV